MEASSTHVRAGDTFELQVQAEVNGARIESFDLPNLDAFEVIAHQQTTPFEFSVSMGQKARITSTRVHSLRLRAINKGKFTIKPAVVRVDGKRYRSESVTIVVDDTGADTNPPTLNTADPSAISGYDEKAFVRVVVDAKQAYVGQQLTATVYLYSSARLAVQSVHATKPATEGFWVHDLDAASVKGHTEPIRGRRFRAYPLHHFALFPLKAGELELGGAEVSFDFPSQSWFDRGERLHRLAAPTLISVKPLPQGALPNTVVGEAAMKATLDRSAIRTGDALTLTLQTEVTGNPNTLNFKIPSLDGLRVLPPRTVERIEAPTGSVQTHRSIEWIVVAEKPGEFTIPPFSLSVVDPKNGSHQNVSTEALSVSVVGNAIAGTQTKPTTGQPTPAQKTDNELSLGPLRTQSDLRRDQTRVQDGRFFTWALALPPALFFLAFIGVQLRRRRSTGLQTSYAEASRPALKRAADYALQNNSREFYDELAQSLLNAISYKLDASAQGMTHAEVKEGLDSCGADDNLKQRVVDELEGCDFARYSAEAAGAIEMKTSLDRARAIIERLGKLQQVES